MPRDILSGVREKLLDAVATANITGAGRYVGRSRPPYTIRIDGVTTAGVNIETTVEESLSAGWQEDFGMTGGGNMTEAEVAQLTGLPDGTVVIEHKVVGIRAKTNGSFVGTVTVTLLYNE